MTIPESAAENMRSGYNCAQAVVKAFSVEAGFSSLEDALLIASGFGGGIGRTGHICGALSGAVMVLSKMRGYQEPADSAGRARTYSLVKQLMDGFRAEHGAILCRDLLGFDFQDEAAVRQAQENGAFQKQCPVYVQSASRILERLLASAEKA
jgi:C_GCAxxG_C_C family probable redox protein